MGVPTKDEVEMAMEEVARMRESGEDPNHVAKVLLNHHYMIEQLEKVMQAADLYLHSGHGSREHSVLVRAIAKAKDAARVSTDHDEGEYGL